jgi:hypothetical protein
VLAAPSAPELDGVAACLLGLDRDTQAARLAQRGDDPALFVHHHAFADWMRAHARDPGHMPHVLSIGGWDAMRWERLAPASPGWGMHVVDTSRLSPEQVADEILAWVRRALAGHAPVMRAADP